MCGIVGVFGSPRASRETYQGLLLLQHRGQDAAGILSLDETEHFHLLKNSGLVDRVFDEKSLMDLKGHHAIGHTRYSTVGYSDGRDLQPMTINYPFGIGMIHNGNVVNVTELQNELVSKRRHLFTKNDLEIILNIFADSLDTNFPYHLSQERSAKKEFEAITQAVQDVFAKVKGGYSVVGSIAPMGMFAFRDPSGIRPLILGERTLTEKEKQESKIPFEKSYCVASESNVLTYLGYEVVRDLKAGEIFFVDQKGESHSLELKKNKVAPCMFEWVYFANPEAVLEKKDVYAARLNMGRNLAYEVKKMIDSGEISPDIVVPVPDTSRPSAIALAEELGISYREILVKNRYIQRSFILNSPEERSKAVNLKLTPVASEFKGKKVLLVDDSIVRGTTSRHLIRMVREAGASAVYLASSCPPIRHPCYYGIDFPSPSELIATGRTTTEIAETLGADKVIYLTLEKLKESIGLKDMCMACLNGDYPVDVTSAVHLNSQRRVK
ncbi:MAG: amidophosphoribosyltransferase [Bacteriovoracaceae bacterium]|nr:amidophosphoribosyltransferase [Bacteriovoracaceae bacterium]